MENRFCGQIKKEILKFEIRLFTIKFSKKKHKARKKKDVNLKLNSKCRKKI